MERLNDCSEYALKLISALTDNPLVMNFKSWSILTDVFNVLRSLCLKEVLMYAYGLVRNEFPSSRALPNRMCSSPACAGRVAGK